ncbi:MULTISPECIES: hypothetical protein [Gordonia]|jgi:hypothetical protein|uniref:hypothetical protein n=1 Tax=Gordonia TaxID=2053 RepID=UPI00034DFE5C|nr:hypothetical protein [Gordonia malaquae]
MGNKLLVVVGSALVLVVTGIVVVARRSRTEHPPVSPTVPRIEDLSDGPSDQDGR